MMAGNSEDVGFLGIGHGFVYFPKIIILMRMTKKFSAGNSKANRRLHPNSFLLLKKQQWQQCCGKSRFFSVGAARNKFFGGRHEFKICSGGTRASSYTENYVEE